MSESVVLVRTRQGPSDPYHTTTPRPNRTFYLPVLDTQFTHLDHLSQIIKAGPTNRYSGVIITSQRAVDAWAIATTSHSSTSTSTQPPPPSPSSSPSPSPTPSSNTSWVSIPWFPIGVASQTAIQKQLFDPPPLCVGAGSGTANNLAEAIKDHFPTPPDLPILYLVGDKNRDTIPTVLQEAGIQLDRVQVYETRVVDDFGKNLDGILKAVLEDHEEEKIREGTSDQEVQKVPTVWFALFSPSGTKHCLEQLRLRGLLPPPSTSTKATSTESIPHSPLKIRVKLAGIGQTTREYVEDEEGLRMHAVAEKPNAVDLFKAINEAER
ncbi:uroporphyrinogen-III synthase, partial [Phenoliferia sp. Uapishka_3]